MPPLRPVSAQENAESVARTIQSMTDGVNRTYRNTLALSALASATNDRHAETELMTLAGSQIGVLEKSLSKNNQVTQKAPPLSGVAEMSGKLADMNLISLQNSNTQCVTYLEYSSQRELPYDNSFFTFLQSASFNASDWKIDDLRLAYDSATEEARPAILSRMIFLSRNPQFQGLLNASPTTEFPAEVINRRQREFFNLLKTLAPPANSQCGGRANGCWEEVQRNGSYPQFKQNADTFLRTNEVTDIVSMQSRDLYRQEIIRISDNLQTESGMVFSPEGYFSYLEAQNPDLAFGCSGTNVSSSCYERFTMHCFQVRAINTRIINGIKRNGADVIRELISEQITHGRLDPQQNMNFETFNDMVCKHRYSNPAGEQLSFFEYRSRSCPGNGNDLPECSDRRRLLHRFTAEFRSGGEVAEQSIRNGFGESLTTRTLASVSRTQIEAANRITETPRELRARFNGGYPTVSPQGQLVPFVPGRTSNTTSVASSSSNVAGTAPLVSSAPVSAATSGSDAAASSSENRSARQPSRQDRSFNETSPSTNSESRIPERSQNSADPFASLRRTSRNLPLAPVLQPQVIPAERTVVPDRSPASAVERTAASLVPGVATALATRTETPAPSPTSEASAVPVASGRPLVQVAPRRRSNAFNQNALLDIYQNADRRVTPVVSTDNAPVIPVRTNDDILSRALNDPQILATDASIMDKVASSDETVVRLGLRSAADDEDIVVYATKTEGKVQFSFVAPEINNPARAPASLGENEMNVRLVPDIYSQVARNPDRLKNYEEVMRNAMNLPGDVVRMNIVSPSGESQTFYLDKRGPSPRITADDAAVIRAYSP